MVTVLIQMHSKRIKTSENLIEKTLSRSLREESKNESKNESINKKNPLVEKISSNLVINEQEIDSDIEDENSPNFKEISIEIQKFQNKFNALETKIKQKINQKVV